MFKRMKRNTYLTLVILILITTAVSATSNEWTFLKEKDGARFWKKTVQGYRVDAYRAQTIMEASPEDLYAFMTNLEGYGEWLYNCREFEVIGDDGDGGVLYYLSAYVPLAKNRDYTGRLIGSPPDATRTAYVTHVAVNGVRPTRKGMVRITEFYEQWTFTEIMPGRTLVTIEGLMDPAGEIPVEIVNWVVSDGPRIAFRNIRQRVEG